VFIHCVEHHDDYVPLPDEIHALEVPKELTVVPACVLADGLFPAIGHPIIEWRRATRAFAVLHCNTLFRPLLDNLSKFARIDLRCKTPLLSLPMVQSAHTIPQPVTSE
jgi:hypothetical protein